MPLYIVRNDITKMRADAIVNAANPSLLGGGGVDGAIHRAAGPGLLEECRMLGGCRPGEAKATRGFDLPCRFVIHTVGPIWQGGACGEPETLASCYTNSLDIAETLRCGTVAFPLISAGAYGYPKEQAFHIAVSTIARHLEKSDITVYLVLFDSASFNIAGGRFGGLKQFIDDNYAGEHYPADELYARGKLAQQFAPSYQGYSNVFPMPAPKDERMEEPIASTEAIWFTDEDDEERRGRAKKQGKRRRRRDKHACSAPIAQYPCRPAPSMASAPMARPPLSVRPKASENKPCSCAEDAASFGGMPSPGIQKQDIDRALKGLDESFAQTLLRKIDESGMTDAQCYKRANVDRKLFSKIRGNPQYKPSKQTAIAFCIALRLDIEETRDLLMKAGYALSRSSKFDVIIEYFILNHSYDIFDINEALFEYDQPLLGA